MDKIREMLYEIDGVIADIRAGLADEVCIQTLRRVQRAILEYLEDDNENN